MARLQRKKSPEEKKKKRQLDNSSDSNGDQGGAIAKGGAAAAGKVMKKPQAILPKKTAVGPKAEPGKIKGTIDKGIQFLREVRVELKKVTWPSRKQTMGSTVVVLILVMIISVFLGMADIGLSNLIRVVLQ